MISEKSPSWGLVVRPFSTREYGSSMRFDSAISSAVPGLHCQVPSQIVRLFGYWSAEFVAKINESRSYQDSVLYRPLSWISSPAPVDDHSVRAMSSSLQLPENTCLLGVLHQ